METLSKIAVQLIHCEIPKKYECFAEISFVKKGS